MRFRDIRDVAEGPALLAGLRAPTQGLLLQLLLYKSVFMGSAFRDLAQREPDAIRTALLRVHDESVIEAEALARSIRDWDRHPASATGIHRAADEARRRFLHDVLALKEGIVDVGVAAAMAAPTDALRRELLALADLDRKHADEIRRAIGSRTLEEKIVESEMDDAEEVVGLRVARATGETVARAIEHEIARVERGGARPVSLLLSAHAVRHARDEGIIDRATGRAYDLPIDVELGWRGECFAVQTSERIAYAELVSAGRDPADWP